MMQDPGSITNLEQEGLLRCHGGHKSRCAELLEVRPGGTTEQTEVGP